jgi:hypothetical protein
MTFTFIVILACVSAAYVFGGMPKFINNWSIRHTYDGAAAMKRLTRQKAKGQIAQDKFDKLHAQLQEVFGAKMLEVERHVKLHDSIDARRARVARRRSLQRKLGRIS